MPNVNFYLKNPSLKDETLILLQMKYHNQRLVYSTGEFVKPSQWNFRKQRLKNNTTTTKDGKHNVNDLLKSLQEVCERAYNEQIKTGIPAPGTLKKYLDKFRNKNIEEVNAKKQKPTLLSFLQDYKVQMKDFRAENTIKKYGTLLTYLTEYNNTKEKIDFDTINLDFFYSYVAFLKKPGQKRKALKQNTIAKSISVLKAIMNEAVDRGHTDNLKFKHRKFSFSYEDVESVYLSEQEIKKLYKHDLSSNKRLEQVRDVFVIGCLTGQRYGDYSSLKPENIRGDFIEIFATEKTGESVVIPMHDMVKEILKKYDGNIPKKISVQKFNTYLKEACQLAGLHEKGRIQSDPETPLYAHISSHTARRSFLTNLYLSGFPAQDLMKISGHKSERVFLKYIKVSKRIVAERLQAHLNTRKLQAV